MKAQRGFTLIELVVVIIVLGILAVTAAPKFIDIQTDARAATLDGVKGALQGANSLIYAKAAINGDENCGSSCTAIDLPGNSQDVNPVYGSVPAVVAEVRAVAELATSEWDVDLASGKIYITPEGETHLPAQDGTTGKTDACQVIYTPATSTAAPTYVVVKGKC